jgi:hypothetical protein
MIPNAVTVVVGLWLAYSAIFSTPAGEMNNLQLTIAAVVIVVCGVIARLGDKMTWPSTTNIALGLVLGLLAGVRAYSAQTPMAPFWTILLCGIAVAITALWSILYRPGEPADTALD